MVRTILTNHLYRGEFVANRTDDLNNLLPQDQWTIVAIPACVTEFTFLQAQESRKRRVSNIAGTEYLLSGKLVDMDLEKPKRFVGAKRFKGGFSYRRKQFDKDGKHYQVFEIAGQQMEDFVWQKICDALKHPEPFIKHYLNRELADPSRIDDLQQQLMSLREREVNNNLTIKRIEKSCDEGRYSQEKTDGKLAEYIKENTEIEGQMQEIEGKLSVISSKKIEIEKLMEISKETKGKLENYDRRQKKIMCQLIIERVEMHRRKVHGRWKAFGEVVFHFNLNKFEREIELGRTVKAQQKANASASGEKNDIGGGR